MSVVSFDGERGGANRATSVLAVRPGSRADGGGDALGGVVLADGVAQVDWRRQNVPQERGVQRPGVASHRFVPDRCPPFSWRVAVDTAWGDDPASGSGCPLDILYAPGVLGQGLEPGQSARRERRPPGRVGTPVAMDAIGLARRTEETHLPRRGARSSRHPVAAKSRRSGTAPFGSCRGVVPSRWRPAESRTGGALREPHRLRPRHGRLRDSYGRCRPRCAAERPSDRGVLDINSTSQYAAIDIGFHDLLIGRVARLKEAKQTKHWRCELLDNLRQASLDLL